MGNKIQIIIYLLITLILSSCIGLDGCNDWVDPIGCKVEREGRRERAAKMKLYQKGYHMTKEQAEQRIRYDSCIYVKKSQEKQGKEYHDCEFILK